MSIVPVRHRTMPADAEDPSLVTPPQLPKPAAPGSFWNRHKTVINFWLDVTLLVLFLVLAWLLTVLAVVFPRGVADWTVWGYTSGDWLDALFATFCVFAVGVVLHVMLHWTWVCGTVATRLMGRKSSKDDGTQTLIGVGFLILLLHLFGAAVFAARVFLTGPR